MPAQQVVAGLKPDPSCFRGLRWRMDLPLDGESLLELGKAMRTLGYKAVMEILFPALISLEDGAGHQIVFVAKSGRVQIRVHYETKEAQRKQQAYRMAEEITLAAQQAGLLVPS